MCVQGKQGRLRGRTFSAPRKWARGKGRITCQFGCCYNYAIDSEGRKPGESPPSALTSLPFALTSLPSALTRLPFALTSLLFAFTSLLFALASLLFAFNSLLFALTGLLIVHTFPAYKGACVYAIHQRVQCCLCDRILHVTGTAALPTFIV